MGCALIIKQPLQQIYNLNNTFFNAPYTISIDFAIFADKTDKRALVLLGL